MAGCAFPATSGPGPAAAAGTSAAAGPPRAPRRSRHPWAAFLLAPLLLAPLLAAPAAAQARIGTPPPDGPCVTVEIGGHRAGIPDCATRRLQNAARQAQARAPNALTPDIPGAASPDVVVGLANQTATRQRMGNAFGTGVRPQRPRPPVFAAPLGGRP